MLKKHSLTNFALPQFEGIAEKTKVREDFQDMKSCDKFQLLLAYIQFHVECMQGKMCHSQTTTTAYTSSLMEMLLHLIRFGFLSDWDQLHDLMEPILLCMDGRTDWLDNETTAGTLTPRTAIGLPVIGVHHLNLNNVITNGITNGTNGKHDDEKHIELFDPITTESTKTSTIIMTGDKSPTQHSAQQPLLFNKNQNGGLWCNPFGVAEGKNLNRKRFQLTRKNSLSLTKRNTTT